MKNKTMKNNKTKFQSQIFILQNSFNNDFFEVNNQFVELKTLLNSSNANNFADNISLFQLINIESNQRAQLSSLRNTKQNKLLSLNHRNLNILNTLLTENEAYNRDQKYRERFTHRSHA